MKKLLYCAAALATLLFVGSCQRENLEPAVEGATVTYTVKVPEAIATKAIGDAITAVDKVYFEVYRAGEVEDLTKAPVYQGDKTVTGNVASFDLEFVKGQNFVVLFWAQNSSLVKTDDNPGGMYDINDLRAIRLVNPGASNNAAAQVFAGKDTVSDCVSAAEGNVTLTRPVSQINVYTTTESLSFGDVTIGLDKSSMTVTGLYNIYNVAAGDAVEADENKATFAYAAATVPTVAADNTDLTYVAMNYVGFAPNAGATVTVDFTIKTTEANDISHSVSNVPVKPNYRTNIVGNLITEAADYNVTLDADWEDDEYTKVVVSTIVDLQTEVNNIPDGETGEIALGGNIDFGNRVGTLTKAATDPASLIIPANTTVVLDLNGYTLSQTAKQTGAHSMIVNNGNLTIVDNKGNGKISYSDTGNGGEYVSNTIVNNGRLVIESGVIENNSSATVASNGYPHPLDNNGELIINGGTLTNNANYASMRIWCTTDDNTSVTITGGTFNGSIDFQTPSAAANKGSLTITGGTFNADTYTKCAVRLLGFGADVDEMLGDIRGGTFNGEIALKNWSGSDLNSQVFYITGGQFSVNPTAFVVDGYPVIAPETEGGYYTIGQFKPVATIDGQEYGSLRAAVNAAQEGKTIILIKDIEQADGVIITDKKLTIDLNDKTFTVTNGANANNRNFKINGSSVVTIKNGTMVAVGEITSGAYGTVRTEDSASVTLENVKLYSYRGYGLNVKACSGTTININNSEIYAQYSGGVEAAGGTINLTNVKIDQRGVYSGAAWCSVAIGVNGEGMVVVNSGEYSASAISTDSNAAQGTWVAYVMSSGGTLEINGGTFNGTVAESAAAANACGVICADRAAVVNINGGTFNSNGAILDMRNNVGTLPNPVATLAGGTFSSDPRVSGLYSSNLITVAKGYKVVNDSGVWTVVVDPVASIGSVEYASLQEAFNVGGEIVLLCDVTLDETVVLAEGKTVVLNLNGKTLAHADEANKYAIDNSGTLTITGNGIVNARGIYNGYNNGTPVASAKLTIENGTFNAKGTNGGACVFNYGTAEIKGGSFTSIGGYSLNNQEGSFMSIADGVTANNGIYTSNATLTVNGGTIQGNRSGCHVLYSWNSSVEINGGNFYNYNSGNATLMAAGTSTLIVNDGTFGIKDGRVPGNGNTWTSCLTDTQNSASMTVNGGTFNGGFRVQAGTTMTITSGSFNDCYGSNYNIYGTARVKGGTYTDATAQNFAKKYIAEGYEMNANGEVVAK